MKDAFFNNKVAVITGAGGTLCSVIAKDLAKLGVKVVLVGRTKEKLDRVASEISSDGGTVMVVPADVTDYDRLVRARDEIKSRLGTCSFLVNGRRRKSASTPSLPGSSSTR